MNVLLVNYYTFKSNSALHQFHLARHLPEHGIQPAICVTRRAAEVSLLGTPGFAVCTYRDARRGAFGFPDGRGPDLIHAWTPREGVRRLTLALSQGRVPYLIHLEDNEDAILEHRLGQPIEVLRRRPAWRLAPSIRRNLSHPHHAPAFLRGAAGMTLILDRLQDFVPADIPTRVIWPAYDPEVLTADRSPEATREDLGLSAEDFVVFYPGNLTHSHAADMATLFRAIALLNQRGIPARLVRTGLVDELGALRSQHLADAHYLDLGFRPRGELGRYFGIADALVQPGTDSPFNRYRFPAKLPEFLATGKPVLLPPANLGASLRDGEEALLLHQGTAEEVADRLAELHGDPDRARRIGAAGRAFAQARFNWARSAAALAEFYCEIGTRTEGGHS